MRLIDADALMEAVDGIIYDSITWQTVAKENVIRAIMDAPTVEVTKVKETTIPIVRVQRPVTVKRTAWCGACGYAIKMGTTAKDRPNFCQHCGRTVNWDEARGEEQLSMMREGSQAGDGHGGDRAIHGDGEDLRGMPEEMAEEAAEVGG